MRGVGWRAGQPGGCFRMVDGRMIALITLRTVFSWRTPVPFALVFFPVVVLQRNTS